ncbi:hypothetical protein BWQ96_09741 [Gracilariopsis chorda]|uniref:Uncharacterized protein n=1 Tax=Gracilariopsis chorda TaxID=448386 RepID=A0A2V3IEN1_9FLOR|nr:hypothetical protein BWQ96_09741 [Gracilariopsis chorda]|eukprot:PXF40546.1 hypothetical protein BWQ96_09741 [Gracilariopsis chorda]
MAPPAIRMRDELLVPLPPSLPAPLLALRSTVPTDTRLPVLPPLPDISVASTDVPFAIYHRLVPRLFTIPNDPLQQQPCELFSAQHPAHTHSCTVANSDFNRVVLLHALYGFSFQTTPQVMFTLHQATEDDRVTEQQTPHKIFSRWKLDAAYLQRHILSLNLLAMSNLLNLPTTWTFTLTLQSSPYYGHAGLEARIVLFSPQLEYASFHLLGISRPHIDIPNLLLLLQTLCPQLHQKLMGVNIHLSDAEHNALPGVIASRVLSTFLRRSPRRPRFFTPQVHCQLPGPNVNPLAIAALAPDHFRSLVNEYRPRLESFWTSNQIEQILLQHSQFRNTVQHLLNNPTASKLSLAQQWALAERRFASLFYFIGGLGSSFDYKPTPTPRVSITALEITPESASAMTTAADIILHARQFVHLRPFISWDACKAMAENT